MNRSTFLRTLAGAILATPLAIRSIAESTKGDSIPITHKGPSPDPRIESVYGSYLAADGTRFYTHQFNWEPCLDPDHFTYMIARKHSGCEGMFLVETTATTFADTYWDGHACSYHVYSVKPRSTKEHAVISSPTIV